MDILKYIRVNSLVSGIGLFSIPIFTLLISSVIFICGGYITPYIFPLAVFLSMGVIYLLGYSDKKLLISSLVLHILFLSGAIAISGFIYDYGFDGIRYHQDCISRLHDAWNPVYDSQIDARLWVRHYAKGIETIAACIFSTTGYVDAGKSVNLMLVFAAFFFTYRFLCVYFEFLTRAKRLWLATIFTFSTVVINQLFSYYVDWSCYILVLIFVVSYLCLLKKQTFIDFFLCGGCIYLASTIKFNIFFWVLFAALIALIYLLVVQRFALFRKLFVALAIGGIIGVFVTAYNPYVTNTIYKHNPFYPLTDKIDLTEDNTPPILADKSCVEAFFISILSFPKNDREATSNEYALPQNITLEHIHHSGKVDSSLGGYGLFFSWIFIASIILYGCAYNANKKNRKYFNLFLIILLVSPFILPLGFYARYFPLFYAFPLVMLLYSEYDRTRKPICYLRKFIYILIAINMLLSAVVVAGTGLQKRKAVNLHLEILKQAKQPVLIDFNGNASFKLKMDKAGIMYQEVDAESCELDTSIFSPPIYLKSEIFHPNK